MSGDSYQSAILSVFLAELSFAHSIHARSESTHLWQRVTREVEHAKGSPASSCASVFWPLGGFACHVGASPWIFQLGPHRVQRCRSLIGGLQPLL